jgi:insertion element IS1 protein InsB
MTGYGGRLWRTYSVNALWPLERLLSLLSAFEVVVWMTDGWPLYESRLKESCTYQQALHAAN